MDKPRTTNTAQPQAVLFDAYGTLFDVYSVGLLAEQLFPSHGATISVLWRDKQIEYTRLLTTCNHGAHYQPFWQVTQAALTHTIKIIAARAGNMDSKALFNAENVTQAIAQLMNQYRHLSAFPENKEVLQTVKAHGIPTGILSNGDPAMLEVAVKSAGLADLLDHVISVDSIRKFKTHPDAYALGTQATGLQPQQVLFVSSNAWDALGATWFGYQTLWVNRAGLPFEELGTQPTRTGSSLRDVLEFFN